MYNAAKKSELQSHSSIEKDIDFAAMLHALTLPDAFLFALPDDTPTPIIQTHASAVLLTPELVYKLKKPKNFGFFDYSTPTLRRHFCEQEVLLNLRLAPQVYLGVAPVLACPGGRFCFGPTFHPGDVPLPGASLPDGEVVDFAVVMVRLPDEATLESRLRAGTAPPSLLADIARYVATFHRTAQTDEYIASFGSLNVIRDNWEENFEQMKPYIDRTLEATTYHRIVEYVHSFLKERSPLFASRVRDGHIRDCHGDLRLQHVYILDEKHELARQLPRLAILDSIEFNERFRYSDVASEIAFLAMELDAAGRPDLSRVFIDRYVAETGDDVLREVLPFYACYRACVRGKVLSFQLDDPEVPEIQREAAQQQAASLFELAAHYAHSPTRPIVILIGGLMGTGKSTVALALQQSLGWKLFSSDSVRKRLAAVDPTEPRADAFGQGLYSSEWTRRTYDGLRVEMSTALSNGHSVLLDASFVHRPNRQAIAGEAIAHGADVLFVECLCSREVALERLMQRWKKRLEKPERLATETSQASDGRPDLYDAQYAGWEAFLADEEPGIKHVEVATGLPLSTNIEHILDVLRIPRFACWYNIT
ncbi:MAG: AAA family ATPase [Ktedonobacteraceae bacterium]